MIEVSLRAAVRPTESLKVAGALVTQDRGRCRKGLDLRAGGAASPALHRLLREQRILDTGRSVMLQGVVGDFVQFRAE